jgi:hypothetical protein
MKTLQHFNKLLEKEDILDERFIEKSCFENEEDYKALLNETFKILKKHGVNNLLNKDLKIVYNQRKNILYFVQECVAEIEEIIEVTVEMKKAGISGDTVIQKYETSGEFIVSQVRNPKIELLDDLTIKRMPRVKLEAKERKVA